MNRILMFLLVLSCLWSAVSSAGQAKKTVNSAADLPRFDFPLSEPASELLAADDATFNAFAAKVESDVNSVLAEYNITDRETLRELMGTRMNLDLLTGDSKGALATIAQIRDLEDKPAARLTDDLLARSMLAAWQQTGADSGPAYEKSFQEHFSAELNSLPWSVTGNILKETRAGLELDSRDLLLGSAKVNLDPQVAKTGGLDLPAAESLIRMRTVEKFQLPLASRALAVLSPYIAAHTVTKPDIWAARDVTLSEGEKLTPVRVAILDSGVDVSLYPGRVFVDPHPDGHSRNGLFFNEQGDLVDRDLQPLTAAQKTLYPQVIGLLQGLDDLQNGIDSPQAAAARKTLASTPPDQLASFLKQLGFLGQYLHGTHVAGIAVRGNPAARLVVAGFNDGLPDMTFPPTLEWAEKYRADFRQIGEYFEKNDVRVVNMSWGDDQSEFEQWINKTSANMDSDQRKKLAGELYAVWREGIEDAIKAAPNTLWICAAGNSNSNASFLGDVPASLELPNLITVGAVDQAGDETSFTSYGKTVVLYADGYHVTSYVPGGTSLPLSGTSMASPNVANLAAKLIALDPKLTPEQTIAMMEKGATPADNGHIHLIDPKATVSLLEKQ